MIGFKDIKSRNELADFLGIQRRMLSYVLYKKGIDSYYSTFEIPKKNGGVRIICAPHGTLKTIQQRLAATLYEYRSVCIHNNNITTNISHAFEKNKSILTNAQIHRNKYIVLSVDLESFFDSFHFGRIMGYFEKNRNFQLPHNVAVIIAQLTCYNGHLPQGAPTSPILTNMICEILDHRILKLSKKYRLDYTRYADDMTFSTNNHAFNEQYNSFIDDLKSELTKAGFSLNEQKTRFSLNSSHQGVTGLTVNKKVNVPASYYKTTRAMAHQLYTTGKYTINGIEGTIASLEGRFSYIDHLTHHNNSIDGNTHNNFNLSAREEQYRMFLFYKYFFAHKFPLIITEGKTDIRYLKAALMNLCSEYPDLIEKKGSGFVYHIAFLHRTERLKYFFGISQDGADSIGNLLNYYSSKKDSQHSMYFDYFSKLNPENSPLPVFLLFDNEIQNKSKPLSKLASKQHLAQDAVTQLTRDLCLPLKDSNLFLTTIPLVDGKNECEIEHLFTAKTQGHRIDGRSLSLSDKYDTSIYYGKEIFSKYILEQYKVIDFSRFKPLLDTISKVITKR